MGNWTQRGEVAALLYRLADSCCPAQSVPLATWFLALKADYQVPRRARSTCDRVLQAARDAIDLAGPEATTFDLTPDLVDRLARLWSATRAAATVNGLLRALRASCHLALTRGWLRWSPFHLGGPWQPDPLTRPRRFLTAQEVGRLLDHLGRASDWPGRRLHALASLWAYTGLRRDEGLRLEWVDLHLDEALLEVKPKYVSRNRRVGAKTAASVALVPMPDELVRVLRAWRLEVPASVPWVFPGVRLRGPWGDGMRDRRPAAALRAAGLACGLPDVTPHVLRRSLATALRGHWDLSQEQVRQLLRHSDLETQRYYVCRDLITLSEAVREVRFEAGPVGEDGPPRGDGPTVPRGRGGLGGLFPAGNDAVGASPLPSPAPAGD